MFGLDASLERALRLDYAPRNPCATSLHLASSKHRFCLATVSTTHARTVPSRPAKHHIFSIRPTHEQVAEVLEARGADGCSLLTASAEGGNEAIFLDAPVLMGGKVSRREFVSVVVPTYDEAKTYCSQWGLTQQQQHIHRHAGRAKARRHARRWKPTGGTALASAHHQYRSGKSDVFYITAVRWRTWSGIFEGNLQDIRSLHETI